MTGMKKTTLLKPLLVLTLVTFTTPTLQAAPQDMIGDDGVRIVVTLSEETQSLSFLKCNDQEFLKGDLSNCIQLGKKASYTQLELKKLAEKQNGDVTKAFVADCAVIIGGIILGGVAGAGIGIYTTGSALLYEGTALTFAGMKWGAVIAKTVSYKIKSINPIEQYIESKILTDKLLSDQDIYIKNSFFGGSGAEFARRLDSMLSEIK